MLGAGDPTILERAAAERRMLLTRDNKTMPGFAYERLAAELPMPGVVIVSWELGVGRAIDELELVIGAAREGDLAGKVSRVPVRF